MADIDKLRSQLLASGTQQSNNALFQVIDQLIKLLKGTDTTAINAGSTAGGIGALIAGLDVLTHSDESVSLPDSRRLLAGTNVTFDDAVANQRTVNVSVFDRTWSVLTDGDLIEPELIYASGDVIMTHTP